MKNKHKRIPTMTAVHELHNRVNQSKAELSYDEYTTSYKNILWIDDRDDNDAGNDSLKWMLNYCDSDTCMQIEQVDLFREAVDKIVHKSSQYDLVIFDINLEKGFDEISESEEAEIENCFEKYHIRFKYREVDYMHSGYFLFRLLLAVGYPLDRMLIFSGHTTKEKAQEQLQDIIIDKRIYIPKEKGTLDIERRFFDSNTQHYYRVRRLVYQACNYWIAQLKNSLQYAEDIPFNKLYYYSAKYDTYKSALSAARFIEMLEHIQLLFPITTPQDQEKLYFKAMETIVSFHEESAKIQTMNDNPKLKRYHSCVRNFRNWSAHNLMKPELSASKFALLFCITLRTYFRWSSDVDLEDTMLEYENKYAFNPDPRLNINEEKIELSLLSMWETVHKKLKNKYYSDLEEAIRELGKIDDCGEMADYVFVPLWCPLDLLLSPEMQIGNFKKSGQVLIQVNRRGIESLCEKTKISNDKSSDVCFKRFCYQWVLCE